MTGRRIGAGLVAVAATAGLVWAAAPSAQALPVAPAVAATPGATDPAGTVRALYSVKGFQAFIDSVTGQVLAQHPQATLRDLVGTAPTPTTSIRDVTMWRFNFNDVGDDGRSVIVQATVFLPSWTAYVLVQQNATVYSRELTDPAAMSPFEATVLLRAAGYRKPFRTVIYAQPIGRAAVYPHPLFLFDQGDDRIQVDSVTREVEPFRYSVGPTV